MVPDIDAFRLPGRRGLQAHEHQSARLPGRQAHQAVHGRIEAGEAGPVRRAQQAAIEAVGPAMVRADESPQAKSDRSVAGAEDFEGMHL